MRRLVISVLLTTTVVHAAGTAQGGGADPKSKSKAKLIFQYTSKGYPSKDYHESPSGPAKSPNGKLSVQVDGLSLQLYDRMTGKQVRVLRHPDRPRKGVMVVSHWAFSPDGKLIAVGVGDGKSKGDPVDTAGYVHVWEVATGKLVASSGRDIGRVTGLKFLDDNTLQVYSYDVSGK